MVVPPLASVLIVSHIILRLCGSSPEFIHQYAVDTYAAQHADSSSKPIYLDFALAGLYLHNVRGFTGKEVQNAHIELARHKESLPHFNARGDLVSMTVHDVLVVPPGEARDEAIRDWSASVWKAYEVLRGQIETWLDAKLRKH